MARASRSRSRSGDPDRAMAAIERDGEALAVLVHDRTIDEEDPGLVEAVASAARLAIENEQLTARVRAQLEEVRASRARIVEAGDEERRKVERDLHDGAQQRLVALAMRLERARVTAEGSTQLIDEATAELREAIAEVRGLARGLYPPILTEAGLAAAVDSLSERTSIPVEVQIPHTRFPPAIEVTAYFLVAEALTNVTRHAGATIARVHAAVVDDVLIVTVSGRRPRWGRSNPRHWPEGPRRPRSRDRRDPGRDLVRECGDDGAGRAAAILRQPMTSPWSGDPSLPRRGHPRLHALHRRFWRRRRRPSGDEVCGRRRQGRRGPERRRSSSYEETKRCLSSTRRARRSMPPSSSRLPSARRRRRTRPSRSWSESASMPARQWPWARDTAARP